jgi:hypothetical protein
MTIWLWIALFSNIVYWTIFFTLVARRRPGKPDLAVGVLHMVFASLLVVAPFRSLIDPEYIGYQLGLIRFEGRATALPAAIFLIWALSSAWSAVAGKRGRWLRAMAMGDILFTCNLGLEIGRAYWRGELGGAVIEFGEHLTLSGPFWVGVLMLIFVVPFAYSAYWALRQANATPPAPPLLESAGSQHAAGWRQLE